MLIPIQDLTDVDLGNGLAVRDDALTGLAPHNLQRLILSNNLTITDHGMRSFCDFTARKSMLELDISFCSGVGDVGILAVVSRCQTLTRLVLRGCFTATDTSIERVVIMPALTHLDMAGLPSVTDIPFLALARSAPSALTYLDISECSEVTDAGLHGVSTACPHLLTLILAECRGITDAAMPQIAFGCRRLQHIDLTGCAQLTDRTPNALATGCVDLNTVILVGLDNISDKTLDVLGLRCPRLRTLEISFNAPITQDAILRLKRRIRNIQYTVLQPAE